MKDTHGNEGRRFCFRRLIQLGHDQVEAVTALEISVPSLYGIASAGILVYLPGIFGIPSSAPSKSRTGKTESHHNQQGSNLQQTL